MGVICSLLLTGVARFTAPYKEANAKAEKVRNILGVLGVSVGEEMSAGEMVAMFEKDVEEGKRGALAYYKYIGETSGTTGQVLAFPFSGPGLWGPVKGFLSLESDMRTIKGISFYEQEETPGLGGEIGSSWFQGQFIGKSIVGEAGTPGIRIVRGGGASKANEVDAITGATMTCDKIQSMLDSLCQQIAREWKENG